MNPQTRAGKYSTDSTDKQSIAMLFVIVVGRGRKTEGKREKEKVRERKITRLFLSLLMLGTVMLQI